MGPWPASGRLEVGAGESSGGRGWPLAPLHRGLERTHRLCCRGGPRRRRNTAKLACASGGGRRRVRAAWVGRGWQREVGLLQRGLHVALEGRLSRRPPREERPQGVRSRLRVQDAVHLCVALAEHEAAHALDAEPGAQARLRGFRATGRRLPLDRPLGHADGLCTPRVPADAPRPASPARRATAHADRAPRLRAVSGVPAGPRPLLLPLGQAPLQAHRSDGRRGGVRPERHPRRRRVLPRCGQDHGLAPKHALEPVRHGALVRRRVRRRHLAVVRLAGRTAAGDNAASPAAERH
mmetsp:Transcript_14444/g.42260  ORF Transcript_14444/g.42260 Transcript_14444/m.42260 type:complete len:294 (+) Transcript_14444:200-1081(+)